MGIDLLKTYEEIINSDTTSQAQLDSYYNALYMDFFVRPELRINQRAGHKSNGEFVEGIHIYPDKDCICELLQQVQNRLNHLNSDEVSTFKSYKYSALLFITDLVNSCVTKYFYEPNNSNEFDEASVFHLGNSDSSEQMANLSDFKKKNCAMCVEMSLASYIVLYVITNNYDLKEFFPFKPYFSILCLCSNIAEKKEYEGHALCGLISRDNNKEIYLLDSANYGMIEYDDGRKQYVHGLYELSEDEVDLMFNGGAIEPTLFRCKHINGLKQISHRAFSKNPSEFNILIKKYNGASK